MFTRRISADCNRSSSASSPIAPSARASRFSVSSAEASCGGSVVG
jgi:hypothetical protein